MEAKKLLNFIIAEIGLQQTETILAEIKAEIQPDIKQETSDSKQAEMEKFFLNILDGLEKCKNSHYPDSVFYRKNGKIYMEHNKKSAIVWLSWSLIWVVFYNRFGLNYKETQEFTQSLLAKHTKMGVVTTTSIPIYSQSGWQNIQKWG